MKIGILTFHNSRNYGAVLQAYGLKESLSGMGHTVEVIDYRTPAIVKRKTPFALNNFIKNPARYLTLFFNIYVGYRKKVNNFKRFETALLNVSRHQYLPDDISNSDFDAIIIGSDQVWSPIITHGPDPVYWGAYKPTNAKLLAYAASSCAIDKLETEEFKNVGEWLRRFDAISVREERLKKYVEEKSSQNARVVLDPTLLAGKEIFEKITAPRIIQERYVFLYHVERTSKLINIAKKVANKYNAKLVTLGTNSITHVLRHRERDVIYLNASVEEMLSLIKYAECVVALSFHGTALSILFEKDFYSVKGKNTDRVYNLVKPLEISPNRIVEDPEEIVFDHIDYEYVTEKLGVLREKSFDWLCNALK